MSRLLESGVLMGQYERPSCRRLPILVLPACKTDLCPSGFLPYKERIRKAIKLKLVTIAMPAALPIEALDKLLK